MSPMSQEEQDRPAQHPWQDFADGFEEVERVTHFVDPDSSLGKAMAEARERGIPDEPLDITGWQGEPVDE